MKRFSRLSGLLFAVLIPLAAARAGTYEYSFDFSPADVTIRNVGSGESFVDLKEGKHGLGHPGTPWIPTRDISIRLPAGEILSAWSVETGDEVLLAEDIVPVPEQAPVMTSARAVDTKPTPRDEASYASAGPYPALRGEHLKTGNMRGIKIASFRLAPIWYVASEKRLHLATRVTVKVTTTRPRTLQSLSRAEIPSSSLFEAAANSFVVNPVETTARKGLLSVSREGSGCQYLVITTRALAPTAQRLADFRAQFDHVTAAVVTIEDIEANASWSGLRPDGKTDVPTKIRNCITWYVQNKGTEYVVLAGDDKVVPKRGVRIAEQDSGHTDAPADLYYSDLDGTWDANGDGTYGYTQDLDGGDMLPDVIVGRIPVQTAPQLADYINKVIAYEQETTDDSDIVRKSLWLGYMLWEDLERTSTGWSIVEDGGKRISSVSSITETFCDGLQEIKDRAVGFWVNDAEFWLRRLNKDYLLRFRPNLRTTFCTGSATSWDEQEIGDYNQTSGPNGTIQEVFNRGYHQVFVDTHGSENGFSIEGTKTLTAGVKESYRSTSALLLTNRVDFVYAEACHNGAFDSTTDPCQAEAFLRAPGGSLAYIACSREGWGARMSTYYWTVQGSTRGVSKYFAQQYWLQVYKNGVKKLGPAFAAHKVALVPSCYNAGAYRWVQLGTNLLGDPLLTYHLPPADEPNPRQAGKPGLVTLLRDNLPEATSSSLAVRVAVDEIPLGSSASVVLEYSKSANFDSGVTSVTVASSVRRCCELTQRITGLSADTTYYFRAKMTMNGATHTSPFSCGFKTQRADYVSPTPVITPASCTFAPYVEVNVASAASDVVVRYTTDGSVPTSASPVWSGTLVVDDTMTIRACAFRDNVKVGVVSEARYDYDTERMGPKGDAFGDPFVIRGGSGSHVIRDFGPYTVEEDEVDHADGASVMKKTAWYEWTAPGTGTVKFKGKFSSESAIYSVSLAAYSGDSMDGLRQLATFGMKGGEPAIGSVSFSARQGTTYRIVAASRSGNLRDASFTLDWSGDLVIGSDPVLEPARAPIIEVPGGRFFPVTNVTIACRMPGSTIRYTTDGSDPTESSTAYTQPIRLTQTTEIRARAFKSGMKPSAVVSESYVFSATEILEPGDAFDDPIVIEGTSGSMSMRIEKFTADERDPKPRDFDVTASVWFEWTAPGSGTATFTAQCKSDDGSTLWVSIGVYTGDSLSALTEKFAKFPDSVKMSATLDVTQGVTYRILAGPSLHANNPSGKFTFTWAGELTTTGGGTGGEDPGPGTDPDPGPGTDPDPQESFVMWNGNKIVYTGLAEAKTGVGGTTDTVLVFTNGVGSFTLPVSVKTDVLVVGGGAGGVMGKTSSSNKYNGNGGNGGSVTAAEDLTLATGTYTITVGAGGEGRSTTVKDFTADNPGSASSLAGTGLATLTAAGGTAWVTKDDTDSGTKDKAGAVASDGASASNGISAITGVSVAYGLGGKAPAASDVANKVNGIAATGFGGGGGGSANGGASAPGNGGVVIVRFGGTGTVADPGSGPGTGDGDDPGEGQEPHDAYADYRLGDGTPQSVLLSYYDGPDTRGFAWQTATNTATGALWLLSGRFDASADSRFATNQVATAVSAKKDDCYAHKAHVGALKPGTYSYRVGANGRFAYGSFTVKAETNPFVALNVNDVQTKIVERIDCWERTLTAAKSVLGGPSDVDMILSGGDFIDGGTSYSNYLEWGVAADKARVEFPDVPWTMASGNHDTSLYNVVIDENYRHTASSTWGCHSYDVGSVHVAALPYYGSWNSSVGTWLENDLASCTSTWRVVMMHFGPYTTVDHGSTASESYVKAVAGLCAKGKVDLVLQAHDHGYSKTLPYLWSGAGYATSETDKAKTVNVAPTVRRIDGRDYYADPKGTVYISAACAGHRVGEGKSYATSTYKNRGTKIFVDTIKVGANAGQDASLVPDTQMFGVLRVDGDKLAYDWYLVDENGAATLFDSLGVYKTAASFEPDPGTDPDPGDGPGDGPGTDPDPGPGPGTSTGDYYVSLTGSDANAGTSPTAAFRTLAHAVSVASEGKTVVVLEGVHEISSEITVAKAITVAGEGWDKTTVRQTGTTRSFTLDKGAKLQGITLTGANTSVAGAGALVKDGTVSYCRITGNVSSPIDSAGAAVSFNFGKGRIDHCVITGNTLTGTGKSNYGAAVGAASNGNNPSTTGEVVIDTCLIAGNTNEKGSGAVGFRYAGHPVTIRNCTIADNTASENAGGVYAKYGAGTVTLVNCIVSGNKVSSAENNLYLEPARLDTDGSSNCIVTGGLTGSNPYKDATVVSTLAGKGFLSASPVFVAASSGDYRLAAGSPAIGAGVAYAGIGTDLSGDAFLANPAIGCYEYGSTPPGTPPGTDPGTPPGTDPDPGPGTNPEVEEETLFFTEVSKHVLTTTDGSDASWSATATGGVRLMQDAKTSVEQLTATGGRFEVPVHGYTAGGTGTVTVMRDGVTVKVYQVTVLADLDETAVSTQWRAAVKRKTLRDGESLSVGFCHPTNAKYWRYADGDYNEATRTVYTYSGTASVAADPACAESAGAHYTSSSSRDFSATFTGTQPGRVFVAVLFGSGSSNQRHYAGVYELTFESADAEVWDVPGTTGGINALVDAQGRKSIRFTSLSLADGKLTLGFEAGKVDANGQVFGLVCKENITDQDTFTLNVTLTDDGTGSATLGSLQGLTDRPRLFILGLGPAE